MTTAAATSTVAVLQLDDRAASPTADPLGLWRSSPASPAEAVGFDAAASPPGTVWRVCLPADTAEADTLLTRAETSLAQTQLALAAIGDPLRAFLARHAATPFASPREPTARSQLELERLLAELPADPDADNVVGFAPSRLSGLWEQVVAEATAFLARLDGATGDRSWVETEQGGQVLAITELGWGDTKTVWRTRLSSDHCVLHQRAVGLAFESRLALVRTFVTTLTAATLLVALFTPVGASLAFPAALRFVAQVLAEARTSPSRT